MKKKLINKLEIIKNKILSKSTNSIIKEVIIEKVDIFFYSMPLKRPYGTARGVSKKSNNFIVKIEGVTNTGKKVIGLGECQPRHKLTGDGGKDCKQAWLFLNEACKKLVSRRLKCRNRVESINSVKNIMKDLKLIAKDNSEIEKPFRGTLLGVEVAFLDLLARCFDFEVSELLKKRRDDICISISTLSTTIGNDEIRRKVLNQTRYPITRVKGSGIIDKDVTLVLKISKINLDANIEKPIWIDINEGYSLNEARQLIEKLFDNEKILPKEIILEGMLKKEHFLLLADLQKYADLLFKNIGKNIIIMADEGLWDKEDFLKLNKNGGCKAINIKAPKAGGLIECLELAEIAIKQQPGIKICLGGMVGTSDLTSFALHNLARSFPKIDYLTAVPPGNVQKRISKPIARYKTKTTNVIRRQRDNGLGTKVDFNVLQSFLVDEQHYEQKDRNKNNDDYSIINTLRDLLKSRKKLPIPFIQQMQYYSDMFLMKQYDLWIQKSSINTSEVKEISNIIKPEYIKHVKLRYLERNKILLNKSISFKKIMVEESEIKKITRKKDNLKDIPWLLDNKSFAYSFIDFLEVRRPQKIYNLTEFSNIDPMLAPMVIKPEQSRGSRGVYIVYNENNIIAVREQKKISSWKDLKNDMKEKLEGDGRHRVTGSRKDKWVVEEFIFEDKVSPKPATDLKFYSFYGNIALILEIKRQPSLKYCFWSKEGQKVITGKYEELYFDGEGFCKSDIDFVKKISEEIPVPFMRIDMLKSHDGLVFGEFTPRPGNFDQFNDVYDRILGEEYLLARKRIFNDLVSGKEFPFFKNILSDLNDPLGK